MHNAVNKSIKPTFLGIGAQKCGSSWIYRILEDHPDAMVSNPKELNFFSHNFDHGFQWYQSFFLNQNDAEVYGEISPSYFYDSMAPSRIASYNPEFSIIITLRDPVERAFSNHLHEIRTGHFKGNDLSFETGLKNNPMYIIQSLYFSHLQSWLSKFPDNQILILFLEDIKANPTNEVKKIFNFLNIDPNHESKFLFRKANESYSEKIKGVDGFLRKISWIGRSIGGNPIIEKVKNNELVMHFRQANRIHLSETIPQLKQSTAQKLYELFTDDTLNLAKLLHLKTLPWKTWQKATKK